MGTYLCADDLLQNLFRVVNESQFLYGDANRDSLRQSLRSLPQDWLTSFLKTAVVELRPDVYELLTEGSDALVSLTLNDEHSWISTLAREGPWVVVSSVKSRLRELLWFPDALRFITLTTREENGSFDVGIWDLRYRRPSQVIAQVHDATIGPSGALYSFDREENLTMHPVRPILSRKRDSSGSEEEDWLSASRIGSCDSLDRKFCSTWRCARGLESWSKLQKIALSTHFGAPHVVTCQSLVAIVNNVGVEMFTLKRDALVRVGSLNHTWSQTRRDVYIAVSISANRTLMTMLCARKVILRLVSKATLEDDRIYMTELLLGTELAFRPENLQPHDRLERVAASPDGTYVAIVTEMGVLLVLRPTGAGVSEVVRLPHFANGHKPLRVCRRQVSDMQWSPDGRWLAIATKQNCFVIPIKELTETSCTK